MVKITPRYSLRTFLLVFTLVAVYFGMWQTTRLYGVPSGSSTLKTTTCPAPFYLVETEMVDFEYMRAHYEHREYLWFFGIKYCFKKDSFAGPATF